MDKKLKVEEYPAIIKRIVNEYAQFKPAYGDIESEAIFDDEKKHYQLIQMGWIKNERAFGPIIHINIKNDKLWIQYDGTEDGVAGELVEAGVPKEKIVLGFHSPYMRKYTEYAVD